MIGKNNTSGGSGKEIWYINLHMANARSTTMNVSATIYYEDGTSDICTGTVYSNKLYNSSSADATLNKQ